MSRTHVLLLVVLAALAVFGLWRITEQRARLDRMPAAVTERTEPVPAQRLLAPHVAGSEAEVAAEPGVQPQPDRASKREPSKGVSTMVAGWVEFPEGFVPQEDVWILGKRSKWSSSRVAVGSDGFFALPVPDEMESLSLTLESRFLWMPTAVEARPGEDAVLKPLAFAVIEGLVVPPAPFATRGATWDDVKIEWSPASPHDMVQASRSPTGRKPVIPDGDGAFELALVATGAGIQLHADNPFGPEWLRNLAPLEPGEVRRVEIELEAGISVAGTVVDENDQPVAGVKVALGEERPVSNAWNRPPKFDPTTDTEGRFLFTRVSREVTLVRTDDVDLLEQGEAEVHGENGDVLGLVLHVVRGGSIEGTVRWPDGSVPDSFDVMATEPTWKETKGIHGRFRLLGLPRSEFRIQVHAVRKGAVGRASAQGVETDGPPVELILEEAPSCTLRGLVVDDSSEPIERFWISAYQESDFSSRTSADGHAGRFELSGLAPGPWQVHVSAEGFQEVEQRVEVSVSTPESRFQLLSAGRVRGRVLDARGNPVTRAWVGDVGMAPMGRFLDQEEQGTDERGRFDIEVSSTRVRLVATARGYGQSEVLTLDVAPGRTIEGIEFRLREACRVEGSVLDEHGMPLSGAFVSPLGEDLQMLSAETDSQGAFALDGLPSGDMRVTAWHRDKPDALATARVTVAPGRPTSIVLRFQAADPVHVRGRITRAGRPIECGFWFASDSFSASCSSGADGTLEIVLQQPGEWRGALWIASEGMPAEQLTNVRRFTLSVPDAAEHAFELEYDALQGLESLDDFWR